MRALAKARYTVVPPGGSLPSLNYYFIPVADDCPVSTSAVPPVKGYKETIAALQYEMLAGTPSR